MSSVVSLINLIAFTVFDVAIGILSIIFAKKGKTLAWFIFAFGQLIYFLSLNYEQAAFVKKYGRVSQLWDYKLLIFLALTIVFVWLIGRMLKNNQE